MKKEQLELFATPVTLYRLEDSAALNAAVRAVVLERLRAGMPSGRFGSWRSGDIHSDAEPCLQELHQQVAAHFNDCMTGVLARYDDEVAAPTWAFQSWVRVMGPGHYRAVHDHADATWSGVYFVDAGDSPEGMPSSGLQVFCDPRLGAARTGPARLFPPAYAIEPQTSVLAFWPAWLQHYVHGYYGRRPRISVAYSFRALPSGPNP